MFDEEKLCEKCGAECDRDSVDIGVGVQYGPWGCPECGWSENAMYDRSEGRSSAQEENPDWVVDQFGGMTRRSRMKEKLEHFGLDGDIIDEVF